MKKQFGRWPVEFPTSLMHDAGISLSRELGRYLELVNIAMRKYLAIEPHGTARLRAHAAAW